MNERGVVKRMVPVTPATVPTVPATLATVPATVTWAWYWFMILMLLVEVFLLAMLVNLCIVDIMTSLHFEE